ncbi:MAG: LytTR family DNA-binding domain-containing protein [Bacteroidota bacterium]
MHILIVEDEPIIARRITRILKEQLTESPKQISVRHHLEDAQEYIAEHEIDLLFLDLNLQGDDGFEILESVSAAAFHTIIVSANKDQALKAFEYGVLDFVGKPFNEERIAKALRRVRGTERADQQGRKYLSIQKRGRHILREIDQLIYAKGAGIYAELFFEDQSKDIHNKNLDKLSQLLPPHFERIHKSYIVNSQKIKSLKAEAGGKYTLEMEGGALLPVSRSRYKDLKEKWAI